jgi:hypothetical protein
MEQRAFFTSVLCVFEKLASRLGRFNGKRSQINNVLENLAGPMAYLDTLVKIILNPPQLISRFACSNFGESKCSKKQNGNFINNWTRLIFFVLFHDYWSLKTFACVDAPLKNVCMLASVSRTQNDTSWLENSLLP